MNTFQLDIFDAIVKMSLNIAANLAVVIDYDRENVESQYSAEYCEEEFEVAATTPSRSTWWTDSGNGLALIRRQPLLIWIRNKQYNYWRHHWVPCRADR